jgi:outer membrane protein, multidrug efflux system
MSERVQRIIVWLIVVALAVLAGCAVGPNYKRPATESPSGFRGDNAPTNVSFADQEWWKVYQDDTLQSLIREALTNNYDVRIAFARVEQAQAVAQQARSQFFPNLTYNGGVSQGRNDFLGSPYPNNGKSAGSALAALNTFWEVDLWGRIRRLNESARAQFLASKDARHAVQLTLLSDVASDYFQLMELDEALAITRETTNSFGESLTIFTQRAQGGTASDLESSRAEAALADAMASIPYLLNQVSATENALCLLLGRPPGPIARSSQTNVVLPPEVPAGLPSALLERRPDVRQAEQLLRSANALIGESVAEFFPQIGLTAFLGKVSPELSAFTLGGANAWGVAAQATGPIFEGGRLVGQYRQAKAARDEARLRFQYAVLAALREVSDALIQRDRLTEIREQQAREVKALEKAVKISTERYIAGKASYYEVLEAQQQLFPSQLNLAGTVRDQQIVVVSLYKALGGGWQEEGMTNASAQIKTGNH